MIIVKYRLNKLPVKTTNNFRINDLEIELDIPKLNNLNEYEITNNSDLIINKKIVNKKLDTKVGLEFDKYLDINITIPKNISINETIMINYGFSKDDALISKITFNYEENSCCNFVINYDSIDNNSHFNHLYEVVNMNDNSSGNISIVNTMNNNSYNFISIESTNNNSSNLTHNIIDLSGKVRVYNVYSDLFENSINALNNIYIGKNNSIIDMNYYLRNIKESSINKMKVEGSITDNCVKNFRGTIDFVKGCSNSIGEESENCILLSDTCRSRSLPQLLCGEENVVGSHGVSSGKVDLEKLFYIMSRGYSKKEAEKLILLANFNNILNLIPDSNVRDNIINKLDSYI